jgi:hypothetical protein
VLRPEARSHISRSIISLRAMQHRTQVEDVVIDVGKIINDDKVFTAKKIDEFLRNYNLEHCTSIYNVLQAVSVLSMCRVLFNFCEIVRAKKIDAFFSAQLQPRTR